MKIRLSNKTVTVIIVALLLVTPLFQLYCESPKELNAITSIEAKITNWFSQLTAIGHYQSYDNQVQKYPADPSSIDSYLSLMNADGSFSDISYEDSGRTQWKPLIHLNRLAAITIALKVSTEKQRIEELTDALNRGIDAFVKKAGNCRNWWYNRIPVPEKALIIAINSKGVITEKNYRHLISLGRQTLGSEMTGQNRMWLMTNRLLLAVVEENYSELKKATELIKNEMQTGEGEGIQKDFSFHQHGALFHQGNYGRHFVHTAAFNYYILQDSKFSFSAQQSEVLSNLILKGTAWTLWQDKMDYIARGRQIAYSSREQGPDLSSALQLLISAESPQKKEFILMKERIVAQQEDGSGPQGCKYFPYSGYLSCRRDHWFASSKISSKKWISTEKTNNENIKGYYLSDGLLMIRKSGEEFHQIFPTWDWSELPGITAIEGKVPDMPSSYKGKTRFAGGLDDTEDGLTFMDYRGASVKGKKSCYFIGDSIILLGTGLKQTTQGKLQSSFAQQHAGEDQYTISENEFETEIQFQGTRWIFPAGTPITAEIKEQRGRWNDLCKEEKKDEIRAKVFSIIQHHTLQNQNYEVIIQPGYGNTEHKESTMLPTILINNTKVQMVQYQQKIMAVIYRPGTFSTEKQTFTAGEQGAFIFDIKSQTFSGKTSSTIKVDLKKLNP